MAKETLFRAVTQYGGVWRRVSRKPYVLRVKGFTETPRPSQSVAGIYKARTSGRLGETRARFSMVSRLESERALWGATAKLSEEQPKYLDGLVGFGELAERQWLPIADRDVFRTRDRCIEFHDTAHVRICWDWTSVDLENEPILAYESFQAAAQQTLQTHAREITTEGLLHGDELREILRIRLQETAKKGDVEKLLDDSDRAFRELSQTAWAELLNSESPLELRCHLLQRLISSDEDRAAQFIVDQLCSDDLSHPWRDALILFVENAQVSDVVLRHRLKERLFQLASVLRESRNARMRPIVCSAIRTYVSLISPSDADSLLAFLKPPSLIETRLVTLQSIVHLCESHSTQRAEIPKPLSDRICELAEKFLDRDWLVPGEKAAIGENATHALAAIGDERVGACVERIRLLGMGWLCRHVARKLDTTLQTWRAEGIDTSEPSFCLLQDQLDLLSL